MPEWAGSISHALEESSTLFLRVWRGPPRCKTLLTLVHSISVKVPRLGGLCCYAAINFIGGAGPPLDLTISLLYPYLCPLNASSRSAHFTMTHPRLAVMCHVGHTQALMVRLGLGSTIKPTSKAAPVFYPNTPCYARWECVPTLSHGPRDRSQSR